MNMKKLLWAAFLTTTALVIAIVGGWFMKSVMPDYTPYPLVFVLVVGIVIKIYNRIWK